MKTKNYYQKKSIPIEKKYLTRNEAANELRISTVTLDKLIRSGIIPSFKLGNQRFIVAKEMDNYIKSITTGQSRV